jgi:hypothetical protein
VGTDKKVSQMIRVKCHDIIDLHCRICENINLDTPACVGCPIFIRLTGLGQLLVCDNEQLTGVPERKFFLTSSEYTEMKNQGMTNKQIAESIGVSLSLLGTYIKRWRNKGEMGK